jgi:hypothetical protein
LRERIQIASLASELEKKTVMELLHGGATMSEHSEDIREYERKEEEMVAGELGEGCDIYYAGSIEELNDQAVECKEAFFWHQLFGACDWAETAMD